MLPNEQGTEEFQNGGTNQRIDQDPRYIATVRLQAGVRQRGRRERVEEASGPVACDHYVDRERVDAVQRGHPAEQHTDTRKEPEATRKLELQDGEKDVRVHGMLEAYIR